ncbi:MAG: hypothetical protein ABEL51_07220 [Salinibacter sp.]
MATSTARRPKGVATPRCSRRTAAGRSQASSPTPTSPPPDAPGDRPGHVRVEEKVDGPHDVRGVGVEERAPVEQPKNCRVVGAVGQQEQETPHHHGPNAGPSARIRNERQERDEYEEIEAEEIV